MKDRVWIAVALLLIVACRGTTPNEDTPSIRRFVLVNADTNKEVGTIDDGDVISVAFPFNIIADINGKGAVDSVTYTSPLFRKEIFDPYALAGDWPVRAYYPLRLPNGFYRISAFVNGNTKNALTIKISINASAAAGVPLTGPLPSDVSPASEGVEPLPVPLEFPVCERGGRPTPTVKEFVVSPFHYDKMKLTVNVDWCVGSNYLRQRVLQYSSFVDKSGKFQQRTRVLEASVVNYVQDDLIINVAMQCERADIFVEYCVLQKRGGTPLCATSQIFTVPHLPVQEPRLSYRPPIKLRLSPGDSVKVTTTIENASYFTDGFSNGGFDRQPVGFTLWGISESLDGSRKQSTPGTIGKSVTTYVPPRNGSPSSGVTLADNGTKLYLKYATITCPQTQSFFENRYPTTILVDKKFGSLVKQDSSLPTFPIPTYPPTRLGRRVVITVTATNKGGGLRASSQNLTGTLPTELTYQWYVRKMDKRPEMPTYAEPIAGATSSRLFVAKATCDNVSTCGRFGCWDLQRFFVDVCNTYGCRRSTEIIPNIIGSCWS